MQRARCYLLGETAVVLELEPPVTLESQQRIWGLAQRLANHEEVIDAIPGMNNITVVLRRPQEVAWEAIDRLQRWWEESLAIEPESRSLSVPVVYGGEAGPDLGVVAQHSGLSEKQVVELHASVEYLVWFIGFQPGFPYGRAACGAGDTASRRTARARPGRIGGYRRRANRYLSAGDARRLAAAGADRADAVRPGAEGACATARGR